jgi:hypothetical protein
MKSLATRTTLITGLAIAGVVLAGTAAIAANIGILNSTDDSSIGSLTATDELAQPSPAEVEVEIQPVETITSTTLPAPTSTTETTVPAGSSYVVADAGSVSVAATPTGLTLLGAAATPGWTAEAVQADASTLTVTFRTGDRTVVFVATLGADGEIIADVTEPIVVMGAAPTGPAPATATQPAAAGSTGGYDDDSHEYDDDHESDDHESDDHESDDHDDDDHDDDREYEGADDDD